MTKEQFNIFLKFREEFKEQVKKWNALDLNLLDIQKKNLDKVNYSIETPIVYNTALDDFTIENEIKLIVVGDNPGKDEQLKKNNKYLVGLAGKIAQGFFEKNNELEIDFRKNVIILNKTPIHTAKTNHLKKLEKCSVKIRDLISETQLWMAKKTADLHKNLCKVSEKKDNPALWLVGYSELKDKGVFGNYRDELKKCFMNEEGSFKDFWNNVYVFQHFSMNRFICDLNDFRKRNPNCSLNDSLKKIGEKHKNEIF